MRSLTLSFGSCGQARRGVFTSRRRRLEPFLRMSKKRHEGYHSSKEKPQNTTRIRQRNLQTETSRRKRLFTSQTLARDRHALRQKRRALPCRRSR